MSAIRDIGLFCGQHPEIRAHKELGNLLRLGEEEFTQLRNEKENVENLLIKSHNQYADLYADNAQLRTSNQRMADVVSAAILWIKEFDNDVILFARQGACDCAYCTLIRAVDKYTSEEK
jgi:hypothetical protein